jgi:5-methylcytosine-specific restriction protein B
MKLNEGLIKFPHAKELFNKLNKFIEENLNEDYKLGHSYFMKITSDEELEFVKEYKIKPLLEEYFYVDKNKLEEALSILKIEIAK